MLRRLQAAPDVITIGEIRGAQGRLVPALEVMLLSPYVADLRMTA